MLTIRALPGDDIYFGLREADLDTFTQVILHKVTDDGVATFLTSGEAIDVDLSDDLMAQPLGLHDVRVAVCRDDARNQYVLSFDLPQSVLALRGRAYRRQLSE